MVISILGILAAVVTMSMVGLTNLAHANANDAERHTVQIALDTMATKDEIPLSSVCPPTGGATTDMTTFPSSAHALSPKYLRQGQTAKSYTCTGEGLVVQS